MSLSEDDHKFVIRIIQEQPGWSGSPNDRHQMLGRWLRGGEWTSERVGQLTGYMALTVPAAAAAEVAEGLLDAELAQRVNALATLLGRLICKKFADGKRIGEIIAHLDVLMDETISGLLPDPVLKPAAENLTDNQVKPDAVDVLPTLTVAAKRQRYLRALVDRIGWAKLGAIWPNDVTAGLEQIYVDGHTPLWCGVQIHNRRIINAWVPDSHNTSAHMAMPNASVSVRRSKLSLDSLLVVHLQEQIDLYYQSKPNLAADAPEWQNQWHDGEHPSAVRLTAVDAAALQSRLVVCGAPGSGKSSFVHYLALCLAGTSIKDWARAAGLNELTNWPHGPLTPIYIELRRFVASKHFPADFSVDPIGEDLWDHIRVEWTGKDVGEDVTFLKSDLQSGNAILILDGLDEVPFDPSYFDERCRQLQRLVSSVDAMFGKSRILITTRPYAYEGWSLPGFTAVTLDGLPSEDQVRLAERLYQASGFPAADALSRAEALDHELNHRNVDGELRDRPLLLTLMAALFLRTGAGGLPAGKGALYRNSIWLLLDSWTASHEGSPSLSDILKSASKLILFERLANLAYDAQKECAGTRGILEIDQEDVSYHLIDISGRYNRGLAARLISFLAERAGVLASLGHNVKKREVFRFAHLSFQEYLAACHLAGLCRSAGSFGVVRGLIAAEPQLWRESGRLLADVLMEKNDSSRVWKLVDDLIGDEKLDIAKSSEQSWWPVWLASVICDDQNLALSSPGSRSERAICDAFRDNLVELVQTPGALPPPELSLCGRILSVLGDPRPGVGLRPDKVTDIVWCDVPGGSFIFSGNSQAYNSGSDETIDLPDFRISKYPVTYCQFQSFIDASDGYCDSRWWGGLHTEGDEQQSEGPGDQAFQYSNHPRERVSWFDAMAFCAWLTAKLGLLVTLPTEHQWEKAARGPNGLFYPYGNAFDASKSNTYESGIGQTSAVGIFSEGMSPYGVADMSGNVWEWTLTEYDPSINTNISSNSRRVLRGGSWAYDQDFARAALRRDYDPGGRDSYVGFRLASPADFSDNLYPVPKNPNSLSHYNIDI